MVFGVSRVIVVFWCFWLFFMLLSKIDFAVIMLVLYNLGILHRQPPPLLELRSLKIWSCGSLDLIQRKQLFYHGISVHVRSFWELLLGAFFFLFQKDNASFFSSWGGSRSSKFLHLSEPVLDVWSKWLRVAKKRVPLLGTGWILYRFVFFEKLTLDVHSGPEWLTWPMAISSSHMKNPKRSKPPNTSPNKDQTNINMFFHILSPCSWAYNPPPKKHTGWRAQKEN